MLPNASAAPAGREFRPEAAGIYRLKVPFDAVYTSVFLLETSAGPILVDCATTDEDVDGYIVPALGALGYAPTELRAIVLTHGHRDHAGGLARLQFHAPDVEVITACGPLWDGLFVYPLAGHTEDAVGVFDGKTGTLLSGDGLQGAGVGRFRCSLRDPCAYRETLARVEADDKIQNILFSHAYEPWNADVAFGRAKVLECLRQCAEYVTR